MEVRLLGPLEVLDRDEPVTLGGPKERAVMAILALRAGRVVSETSLIEALWGENPPRSARKTVQTYVLRVRKAISGGRAGDGDLVIETQAPGYVLRLGNASLDVDRCEQLVAEARQRSEAGDPARALNLLDDALALWRGPSLEEFADEPFAMGEAVRLEERRLSILEQRIDAMLALGRHRECIAELESLVAAHPLRERQWAQLMLALYRSGRQADALRAYQRARKTLGEEIGIDPGPELRRLEQAIIVQDPSLGAHGGSDDVSHGPSRDPERVEGTVGTGSPHPGNLPLQLTSFIGRERDMREVTAWFESGRVITLTGPGGVGKTRLALEVASSVASRFADGVRLCELAAVEEPDAVIPAIATALSVQGRAGLTLSESVVESLRARHLLLVLDNCEHVLEPVGTIVEAIVQSCPSVTIMSTSRSPLVVEGECVRLVEPLSLPETAADSESMSTLRTFAAVALFVDRASAARAGFRMTEDNATAVADICRRLDGVPLAIELAAARIRSMGPHDIARRLDDRFRLLTGGRRAAQARQRTLRGTVDWSYSLLDDTEQRVFNRLSVFAGGFELGAAEEVCARPPVDVSDVALVVAGLVEKSMVAPFEGSSARYRVLETLREYGYERMEELGETASIRRRHAEYYARLAEQAEPHLRGPDEAAWVKRVDDEFYNLRAAHLAAVASGDADLAIRLVAPLMNFAIWRMRNELGAWAEAAISMPEAILHPLLPAVIGTAGYGAWARGAIDQAMRFGEQGLAAATGRDPAQSWWPRQLLAQLALFQRRFEAASELVELNLSMSQDTDDKLAVTYARWLKAAILSAQGKSQAALAVAEEALASAREARNPTAIALGLHAVARELRRTDPQRASSLFAQSASFGRSVRSELIVGMATREATGLRAAHGDPYEALRAYPAQINHWYRAGDWLNQWMTLRKLAAVLFRIEQDEASATLHAAASAAQTARPPTPSHRRRMEVLARRLGRERFEAAVARGAAMAPHEVLAYALAEIERVRTERGEPATGLHGPVRPSAGLVHRLDHVGVLVGDDRPAKFEGRR